MTPKTEIVYSVHVIGMENHVEYVRKCGGDIEAVGFGDKSYYNYSDAISIVNYLRKRGFACHKTKWRRKTWKGGSSQ